MERGLYPGCLTDVLAPLVGPTVPLDSKTLQDPELMKAP
jgi:hypothetical protein